ncbi:hypothetical protein FNH08_02005 [Streptomyces spongiae]|uniref:Uncharacterized protein n=1 Tax=Streptomyces spongiae TaxID=565072 RepID=A0A5N8XA23_9ACTN|nr:hypothetical protein [Streptomyces spongiae]
MSELDALQQVFDTGSPSHSLHSARERFRRRLRRDLGILGQRSHDAQRDGLASLPQFLHEAVHAELRDLCGHVISHALGKFDGPGHRTRADPVD